MTQRLKQARRSPHAGSNQGLVALPGSGRTTRRQTRADRPACLRQAAGRWQKYADTALFSKNIQDWPKHLLDRVTKTMVKKYNEWYNSKTPLKRLIISFILNWFYWLIAWLIAEQFVFDEKRSWKYHVFHATWMAFFMTIPFNWKELKQIFKSQSHDKKFENEKHPTRWTRV